MNYFRSFCPRLIFMAITCFVLAASNAADGNARNARQPPAPTLNREFKLNVGQQVAPKGTRLRITFVRVENDSRCPKDVKCVWAGNAAVQFHLSAGRRSKTVTLNTSGNSTLAREAEYQGYKVKLIELSPYPRSDRRIAARDYTATLLVSKE
ncbi:MAG: hypothetical protein ABJA18_13200 [bacterium]